MPFSYSEVVTLYCDGTINQRLESCGLWINHPRNLLAVFENEKGRNTLNVVTLHRLGVGIDIQLGKEHLPLIRIAQELKNRRHIEAFASPRGTEVDDHKRLRREHFALEILITHIDQVRMAARWRELGDCGCALHRTVVPLVTTRLPSFCMVAP